MADTLLEPCPFCGSTKVGLGGWDHDVRVVNCDTCGATGPCRWLEEGGTSRRQARNWWDPPRYSEPRRPGPAQTELFG